MTPRCSARAVELYKMVVQGECIITTPRAGTISDFLPAQLPKGFVIEDIAILTGGKFISEDLGLKLENVTVKDLGKAKRIHVEKEFAIIVDGVASNVLRFDYDAPQITQVHIEQSQGEARTAAAGEVVVLQRDLVYRSAAGFQVSEPVSW